MWIQRSVMDSWQTGIDLMGQRVRNRSQYSIDGEPRHEIRHGATGEVLEACVKVYSE